MNWILLLGWWSLLKRLQKKKKMWSTRLWQGPSKKDFQKKDYLTKRSGEGASGQNGLGWNWIKQGDGAGDETFSTVSNNDSQIALRIIPVIVSNAKNKLVVKALLDDGSTKSYVDSDVDFQLGTHSTVQEIQIGVLNGKLETLDVVPV